MDPFPAAPRSIQERQCGQATLTARMRSLLVEESRDVGLNARNRLRRAALQLPSLVSQSPAARGGVLSEPKLIHSRSPQAAHSIKRKEW